MSTNKKRITTVLLDAGGVILDESEHEEVRAEIAVEILSTINPGYSVDSYCLDIEEAVKCFCPSTYQYVLWKYLRNNQSLFDKVYRLYLETWQQRKPALKLNPGIKRELRLISQSFKLGIAGQYGREVLELLKEASILDYFSYQLTQDGFTITKPDPRYYEQITEAFGVDPRKCIMVGDRIDKDIIPAKQLGMRTVLVRVGLHENQQSRVPFEVPDAEVNGILGLATTIEEVARMK
ncbi:MAG: HAD family hydrolase [Candidatus Bathyarchaeum sp.]|nr:MAG: HAD family hydrolase [Candidatus Bathyarchaeum sp.]